MVRKPRKKRSPGIKRMQGAVHFERWIAVSHADVLRWSAIGGVPLIADRRSEIEAALNDYALFQVTEDESPRPGGVRPIVAKLRASAHSMAGALRVLNAEGRADAERERFRIRREVVHSLLSAYMGATNVPATLGPDLEKTISAIEHACASALDEIPKKDDGRLPLIKKHFKLVVCTLAEIFCEAGEPPPTLSWAVGRAGKRDRYPRTSFFLLVSAVNDHLPESLQFPRSEKGTTFAKFVSGALADWGKHRKD